jgi:hypothetical protein
LLSRIKYHLKNALGHVSPNRPEVVIRILPVAEASDDGSLHGILNHHDRPGPTIRMQLGVCY